MQYRRLGDTGMKISTISLGGWINFEEGKLDLEHIRNITTEAYDNGINFYDLADVYGRGSAEEQMGKIFKDFPRHTLVISSKLYWPMSDDINDRGLSRKHIMESIDKTLKRLGTDYLDIYFCHRPDPETPIRETARAMNDIISAGKVLYWGTSKWESHQIVEAYEICERYGWHLPKTEQPEFSMLEREKVQKQILPTTLPRGIGVVPFSPLAMGMLTGKYDAGIPDDSRFAREDWAKDRKLTDRNVRIVRSLKPFADDLGITRAQLALAWVLDHAGVSSVITGATKITQVKDNVQAAEIKLPVDVLDSINALLEDPD